MIMRDKSRIISEAKPLWIKPQAAAQLVRNARMRLPRGDWFWREAGKPDSLAVVCLHGAAHDGGQWQGLLEALGRSTHCLAPDLPGVGESGRPRWESLPGLLAAIDEWLDALRVDRLWLLGADLGAWIAISYALYRPHRVLGVLLVDPEQTLKGAQLRFRWPQLGSPRRRQQPAAPSLLKRAVRSPESPIALEWGTVRAEILETKNWDSLVCPVWTLRAVRETGRDRGRSAKGPHAAWLAQTRQAFLPLEGGQQIQEAPELVAEIIARTMANPRSPILQLDL